MSVPLTPDDLANPKRKSGFEHVGAHADARPGRTNPRPYNAQSGRQGKPRRSSDPVGGWYGPARATAEEAAQDYCDYINASALLVPADLVNPNRKSGFNHVNSAAAGRGTPGLKTITPKWRASSGWSGSTRMWSGPVRPTSAQAAQDYCDYINAGKSSLAVAQPRPARAKKAAKPTTILLQRPQKQARPQAPQRVQSSREKALRAALKLETAANPPAKLHNPVAYLVGVQGDDAAVKVGHADYNVYSRLDSLQTGSYRTLVLLGTIPGGASIERALHARYEPDNVLNEWFRPTPELLSEFDLSESDYHTSIGLQL